MTRTIDLNADLGEGIGDDEGLLGLVTSVSLATGAHAGGGEVLAAAAAAAANAGVVIGAHPAYRDVAGFGRRSELRRITEDLAARQDLLADLVGQITDVALAAARFGQPLRHVKPHGALYNDAVADEVVASVVAGAVQQASEALGNELAVYTQPGGLLEDAAARAGVPVVLEGFADRAYDMAGRLIPRDRPGAVLATAEEMAAQAVSLADGRVVAVTGEVVEVAVRSLCVHGDTPGAVAAAEAVRDALLGAGWRIAPPWPPES